VTRANGFSAMHSVSTSQVRTLIKIFAASRLLKPSLLVPIHSVTPPCRGALSGPRGKTWTTATTRKTFWGRYVAASVLLWPITIPAALLAFVFTIARAIHIAAGLLVGVLIAIVPFRLASTSASTSGGPRHSLGSSTSFTWRASTSHGVDAPASPALPRTAPTAPAPSARTRPTANVPPATFAA
jgi:hypothetical protein